MPEGPNTPEDGVAVAERAADWAGYPLDTGQVSRLSAYAQWLVDEAIPAGGLGPREASRVWTRHIADSITFAAAWRTPPAELLDLGTGVGLPGIPLGILWPDCHVMLLDRAGRRIRLLRRVVRILGLEHMAIAQGDAFSVAEEWDAMAYRGSLKPMEAVGLCSKLLTDRGTGVFGLSRRAETPPDLPSLVEMAGALGLAASPLQVPTEVLDGPAWLLIMGRT